MSVGDLDSELTAWQRRVRGCLLGGALGDALGAPFEGSPVVTAGELRAWVDSDGPLRWTDDTALQVALAGYLAGLEHPSSFDDDQLARSFATTWESDPHRGYGANPPLIFRTVLAGGSQPLGQDGGALIAVAAQQAFTAADIDPSATLAGCAAELATPTFRDAIDAVAHSRELADPVEAAGLTGSGDGSLPERLLRRLEQRERLSHVADALADRTYSWRIT